MGNKYAALATAVAVATSPAFAGSYDACAKNEAGGVNVFTSDVKWVAKTQANEQREFILSSDSTGKFTATLNQPDAHNADGTSVQPKTWTGNATDPVKAGYKGTAVEAVRSCAKTMNVTFNPALNHH